MERTKEEMLSTIFQTEMFLRMIGRANSEDFKREIMEIHEGAIALAERLEEIHENLDKLLDE